MRKFIEKINNWIQWTKQWHFFHVFFGIAFLIFSWNSIFYIVGGIIEIVNDLLRYYFDPNCIKSELEFGMSFFAFLPLQILGIIFSSILGFITGIIVEFVIYIKRRNNTALTIQSKFLLNNKWYSVLYILEVYSYIRSFVFLLIMLLPELLQ